MKLASYTVILLLMLAGAISCDNKSTEFSDYYVFSCDQIRNDLLSHQDENVRHTAAELIQGCTNDVAIPALISSVISDPNESVAQVAAISLWRIPESGDAVNQLFLVSDEEMRLRLHFAVSKPNLETLVAGLRSVNPSVRQRVIRANRGYHDDVILQHLKTERDPSVLKARDTIGKKRGILPRINRETLGDVATRHGGRIKLRLSESTP